MNAFGFERLNHIPDLIADSVFSAQNPRTRSPSQTNMVVSPRSSAWRTWLTSVSGVLCLLKIAPGCQPFRSFRHGPSLPATFQHQQILSRRIKRVNTAASGFSITAELKGLLCASSALVYPPDRYSAHNPVNQGNHCPNLSHNRFALGQRAGLVKSDHTCLAGASKKHLFITPPWLSGQTTDHRDRC